LVVKGSEDVDFEGTFTILRQMYVLISCSVSYQCSLTLHLVMFQTVRYLRFISSLYVPNVFFSCRTNMQIGSSVVGILNPTCHNHGLGKPEMTYRIWYKG